MLCYVWAEDRERNIGYEGHLPWHLPADLAHFKKLTINHPIIMGRTTFDSLPGLLPKRQHIVLTHDKELKEKYCTSEQVMILSSIDNLNDFINQHKDEDLCAIGGVSIFEALMDQVDVLDKTEIDATFKADTKMPKIDYSKFELIAKKHFEPDEKNKYPYTYLTYKRK